MSLALLFHYLMLNMFRILIHLSPRSLQGCIALVRCVLVLRCGLAVVVWYPYAGWSTNQYPWNNSTNKSQAPEDGCINIPNMLNIKLLNNKTSDIKLVSICSTIKMIHGPIYIRSIIFAWGNNGHLVWKLCTIRTKVCAVWAPFWSCIMLKWAVHVFNKRV